VSNSHLTKSFSHLWFTTASNLIPTQTTLTAGMGILPFFPNQHIAGQAGPGHGNAQEKQPALVGKAEGNFSGSQAYLQSFPNLTAGGLLTGHHKQQQSQPRGTEISSGAASKNQTSLLGEPPKEIRLSKNPYLNLASVLPSVCLSSPANKTTLQKTGIASNILDAISQGNESQHTLEKCISYSQPFGDYAQHISFSALPYLWEQCFHSDFLGAPVFASSVSNNL